MSAPAREPLMTRPFLLASAGHFCHALALHLYLHLPGFLQQIGANEVAIGLLSSATAATSIAARPLLGRSMDAWGRRPLIVAGGALHALVCALYATVGGLGPWIVTVRVGHGLAVAMLFASLFAFAADIVPASRRIEGIGLFGISGLLPFSLSSLLGDAILGRAGYGTLFVASASFSLIGLLLTLPLRDPGVAAVARGAGAEGGAAGPGSAAAAPSERSRGVLAAIAQRDLWPLWIIGLAFATAIAAPITFLKTFVLEAGIGAVGGFSTAYAAAAIGVRVALGSLPDRVGPERVLPPAVAFTAIGSCLLAVAWSSTSVSAAGLFFGLGHGYAYPILLGLVVARARPAERGAAMSVFSALFDAGTLLGAPLLGLIIRGLGYPAMFAAAAAVAVAGLAVFLASDRRRPAVAPERSA
ncbi:MFS transporter [Sorangium sp. So ce1099]|uniref:MFS transporter n=1 Tax=Sorangium sp. So ce1099 TaxID=3133331 RepID=UPI003F60AA90